MRTPPSGPQFERTVPIPEPAESLISVGAGDDDATYSLRHGGDLGEAGAWRAYVTGHVRGESLSRTGLEANDGAEGTRAGARADWALGATWPRRAFISPATKLDMSRVRRCT